MEGILRVCIYIYIYICMYIICIYNQLIIQLKQQIPTGFNLI